MTSVGYAWISGRDTTQALGAILNVTGMKLSKSSKKPLRKLKARSVTKNEHSKCFMLSGTVIKIVLA